MVSGVQLSNGEVQKADIYIMALGIMANPLGRSVGLNLPVYPLKGNIVTVPLKVNSLLAQTQRVPVPKILFLLSVGTFGSECLQSRPWFVDLPTQTQFRTNFRRRTGRRIQLEVIFRTTRWFSSYRIQKKELCNTYRFNTRGCDKILEDASKVFKPGFFDESKAEYFAGLRPVCADDIPIIGKLLLNQKIWSHMSQI